MAESIYLCPFCQSSARTGHSPDITGHLYVNARDGVYHCFRCGEGGSSSLLNLKGMIPKHEYENNLPSMVRMKAPAPLIHEVQGYSRTIPIRYLCDIRGLTLEEVSKYGIRYSAGRNQLFFPVYGIPGGEPLWYQSKDIAGGDYRTPKGNPFVSCTLFRTWGTPLFRRQGNPVVLTEGVFDAIRVGRVAPAVAAFGKNIPEGRLLALTKLAKFVIVLLDSDTQHLSQELVFRVRELGVPAVMGDITRLNGDPGDTDTEVLYSIIKEATDGVSRKDYAGMQEVPRQAEKGRGSIL